MSKPKSNRRLSGRERSKRIIADYIAGMTDRFAMAEYGNLCEGGKELGFDPAVWKNLEG